MDGTGADTAAAERKAGQLRREPDGRQRPEERGGSGEAKPEQEAGAAGAERCSGLAREAPVPGVPQCRQNSVSSGEGSAAHSGVNDGEKMTLEEHLRALRELRDAALADGSYGAAVRAEIARGKASGLYDGKSGKEEKEPEQIRFVLF